MIKKLIEIFEQPSSGDFIEKNKDSDPLKLILKYSHDPVRKELSAQLAQRKKLSKKLPGWTANKSLIFPNSISTEQCSSEATARLKSSLITGKELLDITGGMGVDTFYLSSSFEQTTYVEKQTELAVLTQYNFKKLQANIEVRNADGTEELKKSTADVVYADPARRGKYNQKLIDLSEYEPNLIPYLDLLTSNGRKTLIKTSPMLDISSAIRQLQYTAEVWIISDRNECKEVLYLLDRSTKAKMTYRTFNILPDGSKQEFTYYPEEKTDVSFPEEIPEYIYEPNASILKGQGTDQLAQKAGLDKLHPNSNFLLSQKYIPTFPGKVFKLINILKPYDKSLIKKNFNVISRNYPDNAEHIQKKLKIKPSKNDYLIATRSQSGYVFLVCTLL